MTVTVSHKSAVIRMVIVYDGYDDGVALWMLIHVCISSFFPPETNTQIIAPDFKEGVISMEDVHKKKALQAPKGTIVLYTVLIVIFIAGVVIFSLWKNPFKVRLAPLEL